MVSFAARLDTWSGAAISLSPVCISRVCKIEDLGKSSGLPSIIASFGALAGTSMAGALLDIEHGPYLLIPDLFRGRRIGLAFVIFNVARGIAGGWGLSRF